MKNDNYTYLNIRLTPDLVEKLIQGMADGQLENQNLANIQFQSTQSDSETLLKAIDLARNKSEKLLKVRIKIKNLLTTDHQKALSELKNCLVEHCDSYDSSILLLAKFNRILQAAYQGQITFQDAELEFSKIDNAVIFTLKNLTEDDLA
jgi:hypothetical protein